MKIIIDRFEGEFAVCELEDSSIINVPKALFEDAKEGDIFNITRDINSKNEQKKKIENLVNEVFED